MQLLQLDAIEQLTEEDRLIRRRACNTLGLRVCMDIKLKEHIACESVAGYNSGKGDRDHIIGF